MVSSALMDNPPDGAENDAASMSSESAVSTSLESDVMVASSVELRLMVPASAAMLMLEPAVTSTVCAEDSFSWELSNTMRSTLPPS